jgi:hypothetical protein
MKKIFPVFILAFILNLVWENLHSYLYLHYQGGEITQLALLRASLFDALFIALLWIFFVFFLKVKKAEWLALIAGIIAAVFIEIFALKTDRWAYSELMPIVPFLNVGMTPIAQLGLLSFIIFKLINMFDILGKEKYVCPECGYEYKEKEWAEKCEAWCREHNACNLEIIRHGRPPSRK